MLFGFSMLSLFSIWSASLVFVGEEVLMSRVARGLVGEDIVVRCGDGGIGGAGWRLERGEWSMFWGLERCVDMYLNYV